MSHFLARGVIFLCLLSTPLFAQDSTNQTSPDEHNPLQPFEQLIGGGWYSTFTYQTFEWGVGKLSVKSKLYEIKEDTLELFADITWYWHPGEGKIKGIATSVGIGIDFYEYTTSFDNSGTMTNVFQAYGKNSNGQTQYEIVEFLDENHYKWTYYDKVGDEFEPSWSVTFERRYE